jgi:hypothetical protein
MTYLLGLKQGNQTALVADTAVTMRRPQREVINLALKTGKLFPGCLYGMAGIAESARQFIIDCKKELTGENTLPRFWSDFISFTERYAYQCGRDFSLLLCGRASGVSRLFLFSPATGVQEHERVVTVGSGKALLDRDLAAFLNDIGDDAIQKFVDRGLPSGFCAGAVASLWLTQRSQGDEVSILEDAGVGGVFHFSYQTEETETRQPPGVILLARNDPSTGDSQYWMYRVAFVRAALVIHCGSDQTIRASMDEANWLAGAQMNDAEKQAYFDAVHHEAHAQPLYEFWGLGVADISARNALFLSVGQGTEIDWNGNIGPRAQEVIRRTLFLENDRVLVPIEWKDHVVLSRSSSDGTTT